MKVIHILIVLACLLSLVACSGTSYVGKWTGKMEAGADVKNNPMAEAMMKNMTVDLEVKSDKTFVFSMMSIPVEGTWTQASDALTLTPTKVMGMDKSKMEEETKKMGGGSGKVTETFRTMSLKVEGDKLILSDPNGGKQGKIVFTREKS